MVGTARHNTTKRAKFNLSMRRTNAWNKQTPEVHALPTAWTGRLDRIDLTAKQFYSQLSGRFFGHPRLAPMRASLQGYEVLTPGVNKPPQKCGTYSQPPEEYSDTAHVISLFPPALVGPRRAVFAAKNTAHRGFAQPVQVGPCEPDSGHRCTMSLSRQE